jgi:hypothetical protein
MHYLEALKVGIEAAILVVVHTIVYGGLLDKALS